MTTPMPVIASFTAVCYCVLQCDKLLSVIQCWRKTVMDVQRQGRWRGISTGSTYRQHCSESARTNH